MIDASTETTRDSAQPQVSGHPPQAGQLTVGWQIMFASAWSAAFFAFAAVWKTSEEIGIGSWWLGTRALPQPIYVRLAPMVLCLGIAMLGVYNVRRVAWVSIVGAFLIAVVAVFDMSRSGGLAAIEFALAASMLLISVGTLAGTIRPVPPT